MMQSDLKKPAAAIRREAAQWATRRALADIDEAGFAAWIASDPRHAAAYREARQAWSDLAAMGDLAEYRNLLGAPNWRERMIARMRRWQQGWRASGAPRRGVLAATAAALLLALVSALWLERPAVPDSGATLATAIAEIRDLPLSDGSVVTLGGRSRVTLAFSSKERRIRLEEGEAFFDVAKDPGRPFIVEVGDTEVRAVGTQFDVHKGPATVRVAVLEGVVEVAATAMRRAPVVSRHLLSAGEAIVAAEGAALDRVTALPVARAGEWRRGRLIYNGASLEEVVADVNRYSTRRIRIADSHLATLRVTTSFRTDQIDEMLESLALALPLRIEPQADGSLSLIPKEQEAPPPAQP
ncbi:MAG: FecR domain-containing protein [Rhodothalassiaceae bacterium]